MLAMLVYCLVLPIPYLSLRIHSPSPQQLIAALFFLHLIPCPVTLHSVVGTPHGQQACEGRREGRGKGMRGERGGRGEGGREEAGKREGRGRRKGGGGVIEY